MRFAGSAVEFGGNGLASAGGSSNYSSAAGAVDVNDTFAAQRDKVKYDELASMSMQAQSAERMSAIDAEGDVMSAGIKSLGDAKVGQMNAQATIDAAKATAAAEKSKGIMSGFGQIASAGIGLLAKSDETIKNDIQPIETALETLRNLKPVTFRYKPEFSSEPERLHHGFIAQEFQKVLPDATYYDESIGKLGIDIGDVIGLLVRANQELEERIGMLEAKQALATV
jgi:hypothetical protein